MEYPLSQESRPHGGHGAVEDTQKRHRFAGARLDEFKVSLRGCIQNEKLARAVRLQSSQMRGISTQLSRQVVNQGPGCTHRRRHIVAAKTSQGMDFEMIAQKLLSLEGVEDVSVKE